MFNAIGQSSLWQYKGLLLEGVVVTLEVTFISMGIAMVIALIMAFLRISKNRVLRTIGTVYTEVGRDTPILVTLLWFTYVLPPLLGMQIPNYWTAIIALVFQTSGYLSETFRSGIESVDKGQTLAAHALGMDYWLSMRRIILPQAFRKAVPDVVNNFVVLFKTSTLVSIVAVPDLMYQASRLVAQLFTPVEIYSGVAVIYLVIVFILSETARRVQRRYQARERAE